MNYSTEKVDQIWSTHSIERRWERIWRLHAQEVEKVCVDHGISVGGEEAIRAMKESNHEVVSKLYRLYSENKLSHNAHLGLTSSDITDNARMIACEESRHEILKSIDLLASTAIGLGTGSVARVFAYTHGIRAKVVKPIDYTNTWVNLLKELNTSRSGFFPLRGLRGSVGIFHDRNVFPRTTEAMERANAQISQGTLHELGIRNYINVIMEQPLLLQTWSPTSALEVTVWIRKAAVVVNKIAQDCRYLMMLGDIRHVSKDMSASSTLSHKRSNPAKFERVIGLMRMVRHSCEAMEDSLFNQILSRSLDDSSVWRDELPRSFGYIHYSVETLIIELGKVEFVGQTDEFEDLENKTLGLAESGQMTRMEADLHVRSL